LAESGVIKKGLGGWVNIKLVVGTTFLQNQGELVYQEEHTKIGMTVDKNWETHAIRSGDPK